MPASIARVILYVKDIPKVAHFYQQHFGMKPLPSDFEGWLELTGAPGSCIIALHQANVAQKSGAAIKIVFGVTDVRAFKREREEDGLEFGPVHEFGDFQFANAHDPADNAIQISNR